jgi:hypothetical protein
MKKYSRTLGKYRITYACGITQIKDLISHKDYEEIYKPAQDKIYDLEKTNGWKPTNQSKELRNDLLLMFGENWFTDECAIFKASITGLLVLPEIQGGTTKCSVIKLFLIVLLFLSAIYRWEYAWPKYKAKNLYNPVYLAESKQGRGMEIFINT